MQVMSSVQVRSGQSLTCTFRAICCSACLSRAQVPAFSGSSVRDRYSSVLMQSSFTGNCSAGYYLDTTKNVCNICPKGSYSDVKWSEKCTACDTDKTTVGAGATNETQCICKLKYSNCYCFIGFCWVFLIQCIIFTI